MVKKKINSKAKGSRGEREAAKALTDAGFPARRGQQFSGGSESPDIICESLNDRFHFEVKFTAKTAIYDWLEQAVTDNPDKIPVVIHRKNDQDWVVILPLNDFLGLLK